MALSDDRERTPVKRLQQYGAFSYCRQSVNHTARTVQNKLSVEMKACTVRIPLLDEAITLQVLIGMVVTLAGTGIATGVIRIRRRRILPR